MLHMQKRGLFALGLVWWRLPLLLLLSSVTRCEGSSLSAFMEAVDSTVELSSGAGMASRVPVCAQSLEDLMIRAGISTDASVLRGNWTDAQLLRLGLLASIALISPWDQNPDTGRFLISEEGGVLVEAYHPSESESDIMLCVVCSLLAVIVMFHITHAQVQFIQSGPVAGTATAGGNGFLLSTANSSTLSSSSSGMMSMGNNANNNNNGNGASNSSSNNSMSSVLSLNKGH